jgi:hypothetical protein
MRSPKTIDVVINEDGSIMIDGHGFEGKECELLNELAKQLGTASVKETRKPEYYKQKVAQRQRQ